MIIGGDPGSGSVGGGGGFPDPPTGSPGEVGAIARSLTNSADELDRMHGALNTASATLAEDWKGYAAGAYHACSDGLASVARGGAESFRDCAEALAGYSRALDHAQSQIRRLRVLYDSAMAAQASASSAAGGLENKLASATKPAQLTKLNNGISSDQTAADNAAYDAAGYARQASSILDEFHQAESRYAQVLTGARLTPGGGPAPGSPFVPSGGPGAAGPGFGVPTIGGGVMPGSLENTYGGVIPVGYPWAPGGIPGYGAYLDGQEPNTSPGDLTNLILAICTLGDAAGARELGELGLRSLVKALGLGAAGRAAEDETEQEVFDETLEKELEAGVRKKAAVRAARAASAKAGIETTIAQEETRATVLEAGIKVLDGQGLLPTGVADTLIEMAHRGGFYVTYAIAKLVTIQNALVSAGGPTAAAAARAIGGILRLVSR